MPISFKLRPLILKELPGPGAEWLLSASVITDFMSLHDTEDWTGLDACMVGSDCGQSVQVLCFTTWILRYLQLPGLPMTLSGL